MSDKQIRDRIVGALSVSMMPMEMEAECVAFLDRCVAVDRKVGGKTNADCIRAMCDEHLANYLMQFTDIDCRIGFCQNKPKCEALLDTEDGVPLSMCEKCLLEWLRQPAKGG